MLHFLEGILFLYGLIHIPLSILQDGSKSSILEPKKLLNAVEYQTVFQFSSILQTIKIPSIKEVRSENFYTGFFEDQTKMKRPFGILLPSRILFAIFLPYKVNFVILSNLKVL